MIPSSSLTNLYVRFIGDRSLLAIAQANLFANIERIAKTRTHTFLANNAQNEQGISRNFGADRYYSWEDTVIDCRNAPNLVEEDMLQGFLEGLSENRKFRKFKEDIEERMGNHIRVEPFVNILKGEDNMRYSIKRSSKIEDFDTIRVGFRIIAENESECKKGFACLQDHENPFKMKKHIMEYAQPFNA